MFEHSVKVPRQYKIAANIVKKVATEGGSVKTLLYNKKLRHFRTDVLYALITETIKHAADIENMFEQCGLFENEPRFEPWLAKVLTTELLFGKKSLPGKSKPELTILSYKEQFDKYASEHEDILKTEDMSRPRYVRINTNLLTTSDAIRAFQDEGYKFIRCTSGSYSDYLTQIQNLGQYDFTQDYHVKTVFVFAQGTKWHNHALYLSNQVILQDKATTLAVHLLAPPPGSVVLDMCAAPGMKTTQLAAYMRNNGKIYAVERNAERYQTLCDFVNKTGSQCVNTYLMDSLDIKKGKFDDTEYILLDPSCSGSGMSMSVHNYVDPARLAKLTSLQEKFLKHAMNAFPRAKRIVYSTCSLYPEENERVISNVVKTSRAKWRVQNVKELLKKQWNNFGSAMYGSMGTRCLYAKPHTDLTTGFFLAVLDRDEKDLAKFYRQEESNPEDKGKDLKPKKNIDDVNMQNNNEAIEMDVEDIHNKTKSKDKHKRIHGEINDEDDPDVQVANVEMPKKKKKKVKLKEEMATENDNVEIVSKKKKRKKDENDDLLDYEDENSQSSLGTVVANLEHLNVGQEGAPPKKKKKRDHSDNGEIKESDSHHEKKSKKKKKKKIISD